MNKKAVVEVVERVMKDQNPDIKLAVSRGRITDITVEVILEAAGHFEIMEAAIEVAKYRAWGSKADRSDYGCMVPADVLYNLDESLRKAGVGDE